VLSAYPGHATSQKPPDSRVATFRFLFFFHYAPIGVFQRTARPIPAPKRRGFAVERVPVSTRALIARINRALPDGQQLKASCPWSVLGRIVGRYYIVGPDRLVRANVDLTELAQELACLASCRPPACCGVALSYQGIELGPVEPSFRKCELSERLHGFPAWHSTCGAVRASMHGPLTTRFGQIR
jgi:hypothetical protein